MKKRKCNVIPNIPQLAENVLAVYNRADEAARAEGLNWYQRAHTWCAQTAERHGLPVETVAAVLAVLSPATSWARNVADCANMVKCGGQFNRVQVATYGQNKAKAERILSGASVAATVTGPKVKTFFTLVSNPADVDTVCIDRHSMAVAYGRTLSEAERGQLRAPRRYRAIQEAHKRAAAALGLRPSEVQAVTWVQWRKEEAAKYAAEVPF